MSSAPYSDGKIDFPYKGETYQTYYKLFGDLKSAKRPPIIVLHGGPGLVHNVVAVFSDLATKYDIPTIVYDQLGNGKSTHLREKEPTFWTLDLFIDELINLIKHFSIEDGFSILGHSWGGILAAEFEVRRQPKGLKRLVLSDSLASSKLWAQSTMELMQTFPKDVQEGLMGGMKEPDKYWAALLKFHGVHGCIIKPIPDDYLNTLEQVFGADGDPTVASAPILKDWTIIDRLDQIRVPTFIINGRMDISQDYVVKPFFDGIQKVRWVTFQNSSHTPFLEERDRYMQLVADFLD